MNAFATGEASAWWGRVDVPGLLVDHWLEQGPLRREQALSTHPVLCCALRAWSVRPLAPDPSIAEGAPPPLRPLARRVCKHRPIQTLLRAVRLRFVEWVVLVPELSHPTADGPMAALIRGWLSSASGARHDRARLGLDLHHDRVRLRVDPDSGARGRLDGLPVAMHPDHDGDTDVLAMLSGHRFAAPAGKSVFTNTLDVAHRTHHRGTVALPAGLLPSLPSLRTTASLTCTRHRWVLAGPVQGRATS